MTIDEQYREKVLLTAIDAANRSHEVVTAGITSETEDLSLLSIFKEELIGAIDNLRSAALIASIHEYRQMKEDLIGIERSLQAKRNSLDKMNKFLLEKESEKEYYTKQLNTLRIDSKRGTVLVFKAKDGN